MKEKTILVAVLLVLPWTAMAQSTGVRPTFFFGGGPSFTTNRLRAYTKHGYNLTAGGGLSFPGNFELLGQFMFHETGVQDRVLEQLQVPDGNARHYSVTGNVKYSFLPGPVKPYVIGGGGWYRRTVEFTEPATGVVTVYDPWWGWVGDVAVPTNRVLGSVSRDAGGVNVGGGLSFGFRGGTRVFAEVRWHRAFHNPTNTTLVPITAGISF